MELIGLKPELVVWLVRQKYSIPEGEEDNKKAT